MPARSLAPEFLTGSLSGAQQETALQAFTIDSQETPGRRLRGGVQYQSRTLTSTPSAVTLRSKAFTSDPLKW